MQLQAPGSLAALFEALDDNALITRFCEAAALYAQDRGSVASQINVLITAMLRRFPELRYSGRMFRGITISPELMYEHKDANSLMKAIVARSKKMSPDGLCSWSQTVEGVMGYIHDAVSPGYSFSPHEDVVAKARTNKHQVQCIVMYEQVGQGISFIALIKLIRDRAMTEIVRNHINMLRMTGGVKEVMAYTGTPRIGLLIVEGLGAKGRATSMDKFDSERAAQAKADGNVDLERKYKSTANTHEMRRENFKPEQYQQAIQLMKGYDAEETIVPRAKKGDEIRGARANSVYNPEFVASTSTDHQFAAVKQRLGS